MDYFPLFIKTKNRRVLMVGGGTELVHKIRLMLKTSADIHLFGAIEDAHIADWRNQHLLFHHDRAVNADDLNDAAFAYIGTDHPAVRDAAMAVFDQAGLTYCVIDDKARSQFITPALVDRDPIVVAIGSEGTGPVIARNIKSSLESSLPQEMGVIARAAGGFRAKAEQLPKGAPRRKFWGEYINDVAPRIVDDHDDHADHADHADRADERQLQGKLTCALDELLAAHLAGQSNIGQVSDRHDLSLSVIYGDDPDLLTRQALRQLHDADVVVGRTSPLRELARREADLMEGGNADQTNEVISRVKAGHKVVVLSADDKLGLDAETLFSAGVFVDVLPYVRPTTDDADQVLPLPLLARSNAVSQPRIRKI